MFKKLLGVFLSLLVALGALAFCGCGEKGNERTSYEIQVEYDNGKIDGTEKVEFYNDTDKVFSELKFNLYANAFRKDALFKPINDAYSHLAYYDGESYGDMQILSVYTEETEYSYEICGKDQNILVVSLGKEIFPCESVEVIIDYSITLAKVNARTGITKNSVNLANFYPVLCGIDENGFFECEYYATGDPYYSDCSDYVVNFTAPSDYVVASSGLKRQEKTENGKTTKIFELNNARSFAIVLSKDFNVLTENVNGVEIEYYYYKDETPNDSIATAKKAITYFSEVFGEYAYSKLSVVQTGFIQGGMEFPGLVMISDALEVEAHHEVIVHETAHQWWMAGVGNNEVEFPFLDEALAEYSVVLFYENHLEYGFDRQLLMDISHKTYKVYCSVYEKLFGETNTVMLRSLGEYTSEYEYVNITYVKGAIMLDELRKFVGDSNFFRAIRDYFATYKFKNVRPEDFVSVFERYGKDAEGFIYGFLDGKVII